MSRLEKYDPHPAMRLLRRSVEREWRLMLFFAFVLTGGGSWFGWYVFSAGSPLGKKGNMLAMFGLAAVLLGIRFFWNAMRQPNSDQHPLFHIMEKTPEKIVWVYSMNTQSMPFGFYLWDTGMMYFKLSGGGEITVNLPSGKLKMVSKFLNRILPHAVFGYTEERNNQFEKDPTSLKK